MEAMYSRNKKVFIEINNLLIVINTLRSMRLCRGGGHKPTLEISWKLPIPDSMEENLQIQNLQKLMRVST